ncbi:conserved lipothrixviral protein [Sulfolobus islandicus filamentous virus 2]|uniref:Conserved lipothrixviral protein n=1 Tax=Sulfolobus islandicus filamentous virus 2 TaxID=1902331 RepID=A0A1D8BJ81_SIFV|nr:conserved lipothrixviral protein [Sulfolobus islandicus filamentous virus 2]
MQKVRLQGSVAYVFKVFTESLKKMEIDPVAGAINEKTALVAVKYKHFAEKITAEINKELWNMKIKDGKLFLVGMKELVDEDLREVNSKILSKLKKFGIDAGAYVTDDGDAVIMVSLNDVIIRILEKTLQETKARAGNHMRNLRVKFGNDDKYAYTVIYSRNSKNESVVKNVEEVLKDE